MISARFILVLVALFLAASFITPTALGDTGAVPTGRTETVTATLNAVSPVNATRYVGAVVAVRTEMKAPNGQTYLDTQWTFEGTANGKAVKLNGAVREYWTGTTRAPKERVEVVSLPGKFKLPVMSLTVSQTRPNVVNVGGLANLAIDGWLQPPFTRTNYRVSLAGQGSGTIGQLPGGNTQTGGAPNILPETGANRIRARIYRLSCVPAR